MPPFLQQLKALWEALGLNQKVSLILATLFVFVIMIALLMWSSRPRMALLYGGIETAEMADVVSFVEGQGVAYEVRGGNAIFVSQPEVHRLRMEMASQGLPKGGGVGFEIFDRTNFGISDFVQRTNYLRAIQGELARTIGQMDGVSGARVMVVVPENRLIADQMNTRPTASVFVEASGRGLSLDGVNAIRHLVANAVEGLLVDDVAVVDQMGMVLSEALRTDESLADVAGQLKHRREIERYFSDKIETLLRPIVGPDGVVARVSAEIDHEAETRTEVIYDPNGQVVRNQTITEDSSTSSETRPGQASGFAANLPGELGSTGAAGGPAGNTNVTNDTRTNRSTTYEINQSTIERIRTPGDITELTASVFVAQRLDPETREPIARDAAEMERLQRMVAKVLGLASEAEINTQVTVAEMPFVDSVPTEMPEPTLLDNVMRYENFIRNFIAVGIAVVVFLVFLRLLKNQQMDAPVLRPLSESEPRIQTTPTLTADMLNELIEQKPDNVGAALRHWIDDGNKH